jgi:hypothetical protein
MSTKLNPSGELMRRMTSLANLYKNSAVKPQSIVIDDFAEIESLISEHAALVAVAEAAVDSAWLNQAYQLYGKRPHGSWNIDDLNRRSRTFGKLSEALANLATVREGKDLPVS